MSVRRLLARWLLTLVLLAPTAAAAQDAPAALVIATGGYAGPMQVAGAAQDGALVATALREAGFTVSVVADADAAQLRAAVTEFAAGRPRGGAALLYFRGRAVSAPARVATDGLDNWLFGTDAVQPGAAGALALGDVLAMLNAAGVERQVVVVDAQTTPGGGGLSEPAARSLRRAVVALATDPAPRSRFAAAFAERLRQSRSPAAELLLGAAEAVGGTPAAIVAGGGASAGWVLNPRAAVAGATAAPVAGGEAAEMGRFNAAIACGTERCLRDAMGAAGARWKAELATRLDRFSAVDSFDPANPRGAPRRASAGGVADPAVLARLGATRAGQYRLGLMYLRGDDNFPTDDVEAYHWFERAAAPGLQVKFDDPVKANPYWRKAMFVLGWFHHSGRKPATFSPAVAKSYWEQVATFYAIPDVDPDAAFYLAGYTERCVEATNHCQKSRVDGLYAHARSVGITRERSPLEPDFPSTLAGK